MISHWFKDSLLFSILQSNVWPNKTKVSKQGCAKVSLCPMFRWTPYSSVHLPKVSENVLVAVVTN